MKTEPDSYVGLLGVDQSVLLLKSGNDFAKDAVFNGLNKFETSTPWQRGYGSYPGQSSGLVTLTNINYPYNFGKSQSRKINRKSNAKFKSYLEERGNGLGPSVIQLVL